AIDAAAQVDTAILAGKITPAERETMLKFATASPDAFGEYVKNKTAHTVLSATSAGATPSATVTATLSQVDKDVAAKLGISEEEFAKQKAADQAKGV
ncbi:MAG: hypothetical protein ORN98_01605, partial [Alphaproteobacteria bacterium]|nr:hypothetical protein [Alphaproteobacteria bacterium]